MRILALDAATVTGWAYAPDSSDLPCHGRIDLAEGLGREPSRGARLAASRQAYGDLVRRFDPHLVLLECPFARGVAATRLLYGYAAVAESLAHENGSAFLDLEPCSVRLRLLGSGNATKADVVRWAREQGFDLSEDQHDEADALALLAVGLRDVRSTPEKQPRRRWV